MQQETLEDLDIPGLDSCLQEELAREDTDAELVRQISMVLEERDKNASAEVSPEVQALFDQFVRQSRRRAKSEKPACRNWIPRVAAALVTVVTVTALMLTVIPMEAKAGSWWDRIVQWSGEVFEFISYGNASEQRQEYVFCTDNPGLQEVYDTVVGFGVTDPVVPMWLPEGYVLDEIRIIPYEIKIGIYARFSSGNKCITYKVNIYSEEEGCEYHIDEKEYVEYENAGVRYFIMKNREKCEAVWTRKNAECSLTIDGSEELVRELLASIYTVRR